MPGRPEQVWTLLLDPDVLVSAIPGCEKLDRVGEDEYRGLISAKIGSVQSQYQTKFQITDKDPPTSYKLNVKGQGSAGFVNGTFLMELEAVSDGPSGTRMRYSGEANVGGKIAQIGQRMVRATAETMTDKGFSNLRARIEQEVGVTAEGTAPQEKGLWDRIQDVFGSVGTFIRALLRKPTK